MKIDAEGRTDKGTVRLNKGELKAGDYAYLWLDSDGDTVIVVDETLEPVVLYGGELIGRSWVDPASYVSWPIFRAPAGHSVTLTQE